MRPILNPSRCIFFLLLVFSCVSISYADLILHYTFDESASSASDVEDLGENPGADGVFHAAATRTGNTPGGASLGALDLTAPGVDYVATVGDADKLDVLQKMTVTLWFNYRGQASDRDFLLANESIVGDQNSPRGWDLSITDNNSSNVRNNALLLQFTTRRYGATGGSSGSGKVSGFSGEYDADQKWLFVAITFDGDNSNATTFFVGNESASVTQVGVTSFLPNSIGQNLGGFTIGDNTISPFIGEATNAWIDDVRIYDEVLSLAALESVRLNGIGLPEPVLLGDTNQDGVVNFLDISPFISILSGAPFLAEADTNEDGVVDFLDINSFIALLSS